MTIMIMIGIARSVSLPVCSTAKYHDPAKTDGILALSDPPDRALQYLGTSR